MHTVSQAFDSRAMPLAEPSTAPCALAFSVWRWLGERVAGKSTQPHAGAEAPRGLAHDAPALDPRLASEQRAAADLHELRHGR